MEGNEWRGEKAALRRTAASVKGTHGKVPRLQVPTATKANVPGEWEKNAAEWLQGTVFDFCFKNLKLKI